jgi:hypothetical protein
MKALFATPMFNVNKPSLLPKIYASDMANMDAEKSKLNHWIFWF